MVIYDMRSIQYVLKKIAEKRQAKVRLNIELVRDLFEDESQIAFVVSTDYENPVIPVLNELGIDTCDVHYKCIEQLDYRNDQLVQCNNLSPHVNYFIGVSEDKSITVVSGSYQIYPSLMDKVLRGFDVRVAFFPEYMDYQWRTHDHDKLKFIKLNDDHLFGLDKVQHPRFTYA